MFARILLESLNIRSLEKNIGHNS